MPYSPHPLHTFASSEERFRLLVESLKDYAVFMLDPEGNVVSWNEGARRIKGYEREEILGCHFSLFYPPEDLATHKPERTLAIAAKLGRYEDEGWRIRKNGTRFWANVVISAMRDPVTNELTGFGKVTRDLTERKQAEERLRASEEQFRILVNDVTEYAIFMLDPEGRVITWNAGAKRTKGYTAEEIIGESFCRFYTEEDRAAGKPMRLLEQARIAGSVRDQGIRVRKDGTTFQADVLITAIHHHDGTLRGYTKVTRDITDQLRQREAEEARRIAEKANEAKDQFLAMLSHELRTPINAIVAGLDYLIDHSAEIGRAELKEVVERVRRNVQLQAQLIDDLLDLTRIDRGKIELRREAVDLHEAIQDVIEICRPEIVRKNLQLDCEFNAANAVACADPTRVRQIFWNLLSNSAKFTPAEGKLTIRTENREGKFLDFVITDTGIGIDPEKCDQIFNAFEQTDRRVTREYGGLGLGLAITKRLVELHSGTITARSEGVGRGATFSVQLVVSPELQVPSKPAPEIPSSSRGQFRILLVDDHADTREIFARALRRRGFVVTTAVDGSSALASLSGNACDVLISDIGLPDMPGHQLMREAKTRCPQIRGVAVSGFGMEEDLDKSREAGFELHFTKPVDMAGLCEALDRMAAADRQAGL